jgi:hypothetical protein
MYEFKLSVLLEVHENDGVEGGAFPEKIAYFLPQISLG